MKWFQYQLAGIGCITVFIGFCALGLFLYEKINPSYAETHVSLSGYGEGRKGMFVLWLLLIFVFTIIHLAVFAYRQFRQLSK